MGLRAENDLPDDERLSAAAITSGKDTINVGAILAHGCFDVLARILFDLFAEDATLRAQETHGEEDKVSGEELLRAVNLLHVPAAIGRLGPLDSHRVDALDLATAVINKLLRHDAELTRVLAHVLLHLGVAIVHTVDAGPLRPGVVTATLCRGLRQKLKVDDR